MVCWILNGLLNIDWWVEYWICIEHGKWEKMHHFSQHYLPCTQECRNLKSHWMVCWVLNKNWTFNCSLNIKWFILNTEWSVKQQICIECWIAHWTMNGLLNNEYALNMEWFIEYWIKHWLLIKSLTESRFMHWNE